MLVADPFGLPVRPLLVASTATARNAAEQVRALYGRDTTIFPPQVLDVGKTFFSTEQPVSREYPGRRYVGISTTGVRLTTAEIRVADVLMAAGQLLLDRSGDVADPYMTLVGYFSATRELAGMARYIGDDVQTALAKGHPWSRLPRRFGTIGQLHLAELTSRVSSADITGTLDQMGVSFDAGFDSTAARRDWSARRKAGEKVPDRPVRPFDVVLATSMLQVGVDVDRLGLMLVVGQPKNTAEYIQASSRVGRQAQPARPRGRARELGPAAGPGALRAVPALPRDVLRPGRGAVGDAVLGHLAGPRPGRRAGQRRPGAGGGRARAGCRRRRTRAGSRTGGTSSSR